MPIVSTRKSQASITLPATATPVPEEPIQVSHPQYSGITVDQRWTPKSDLITHIEGSSWIVAYYSQVLGNDSPLSGQQLTVSPAYQSYKKIIDFELKVTSALSTSQDDESKEMTVSGGAAVYHALIPNEGDMFIADIGEGKFGVFRVTSTVKKSIFKTACYEINYSLDTDQGEKKADLESKVVTTLHFSKDYLNLGKDPLILTSDHTARLELKRAYEILSYQYFKKFLSHEYKTLILPNQGGKSIYDPYLTKFVLDTVDNWECQDARWVRLLSVDDDPVMKCTSLWMALLKREAGYLDTSFTRVGLVSARTFAYNARFNGIRYTGVGYVVYPTDPVVSVDGELVSNTKPLSVLKIAASVPKQGQLNAMVRAVNLQNSIGYWSEVFPVTHDECYVLSNAFYERSTEQSYLESTVWRFIEGQAIEAQVLIDAAKAIPAWGLLEQFYYTPIIMLMTKCLIMEGR